MWKKAMEDVGNMTNDKFRDKFGEPVSLQSILDKLESGKFPELTYVGLKYSKLDLINDIKSLQRRIDKIGKDLEIQE